MTMYTTQTSKQKFTDKKEKLTLNYKSEFDSKNIQQRSARMRGK